MNTNQHLFPSLQKMSIPHPANLMKVEYYIRAIDAFSRTGNQCVYLLDLWNTAFLYFSDFPLFFSGKKSREIIGMGHTFYETYIHPDDLVLLRKTYKAAIIFYHSIPFHERLKYTFSHDLRLKQLDENYILVNHKLIPLSLDSIFNPWLALCVISLSPLAEPGRATMSKENCSKLLVYDYNLGDWQIQKTPILSKKEKEILALSIKGFTITQIAEEQSITEATVKFHKGNIVKKFGVKNMSQAIAYVINHNLLK
ncbi:response regulator transcription factor [Niabella sp. CJ426]|uniref:helix-turn-helix transcriptional regulator n=1 Tax=Niabella sp. CJ426 TaxID=3393740 RepID=UPI003CFE0846